MYVRKYVLVQDLATSHRQMGIFWLRGNTDLLGQNYLQSTAIDAAHTHTHQRRNTVDTLVL